MHTGTAGGDPCKDLDMTRKNILLANNGQNENRSLNKTPSASLFSHQQCLGIPIHININQMNIIHI